MSATYYFLYILNIIFIHCFGQGVYNIPAGVGIYRFAEPTSTAVAPANIISITSSGDDTPHSDYEDFNCLVNLIHHPQRHRLYRRAKVLRLYWQARVLVLVNP